MTNTTRTQLLKQISESFHVLKRAMHMHALNIGDPSGLSPAQLILLSVIHHSQPISHKKLAKIMQFTPGAVSQLLEGLTEAGCFVKITDKSARRISSLSVTRQGKRIMKSYKKQRPQVLSRATADVDDADL